MIYKEEQKKLIATVRRMVSGTIIITHEMVITYCTMERNITFIKRRTNNMTKLIERNKMWGGDELANISMKSSTSGKSIERVVTVQNFTNFGKKREASINWSAIGHTSIEDTLLFIEALKTGVKEAKKFQAQNCAEKLERNK